MARPVTLSQRKGKSGNERVQSFIGPLRDNGQVIEPKHGD